MLYNRFPCIAITEIVINKEDTATPPAERNTSKPKKHQLMLKFY